MIHIGLVGFGEAGYHISKDFPKDKVALYAYDAIATQDTPRAVKVREHAAENGVTLVGSLRELAEKGDYFFCFTSANAAVPLAQEMAGYLHKGQVYMDMNSTAPVTKEHMASFFETSEGDFVEAAVMSSVPANRTHVPICLGGSKAEETSAALNALGMNTKAVGEKYGKASAMKMLKSVLSKGMIALITETVFCTEHYDITDYVLESVRKVMLEEMDYKTFCHYNVASAAIHNARFCQEMEQVLETMDSIHENAIMTQATLKKFQWLHEQGYADYFAERPTTYDEVLAVKHQIEMKNAQAAN